MNTIYKLVWSAATGKYVVASELAKGRKKTGRHALVGALAIALAASAPFGAAFAADTTTTADTCITLNGQLGTLNTTGVCTADTAGTSSAKNSRSIGVLDTSVPTNSLAGGAGNSNFDIAIGAGAATNGQGAIAISGYSTYPTTASGTSSIAIGSYTTASGEYSVALGRIAVASGEESTAVGNGASATVANSTALGANAVADRTNTVSVGNDGTNGLAAFTSQIVNVGNGTQANDAVNVSQLTPVVNALGGGASIDPTTGAITGPTYTVGNGSGGTTTVNTVAGAVSNLDGRVTTNEGNINTLQQQIGDGTVGLVQQDATTGNITVAAATGGSTIDMGGTAGARVVTGVAEGNIADGSTDAVNGSQLNATNTQVAQNTSDIGTLNTNVSSLSTSITNLDGRVTTNEGNINTLQQQLSDGTVGLVQQDAVTGNITVASGTGGSSVNMAGTSGPRVVSGVANGTDDTDAVTIAQLKAVGLVDPIGNPMAALVYDDLSLASATLGGSNGTVINNLASGLIASGSMQAVNGGQLFDMQQNFQNQFNLLNGQYTSLDGRLTTIEQGVADGTIGGGSGASPGTGDSSTQVGDGAIASGDGSTAVGNGSVASGSNSTATGTGSQATGNDSTANGAGAIASGNGSTASGAGAIASGNGSTANGNNASATGTNSTALGSNSSATGNNSVALGAGSVADRDNTVSVGSPGNERQITNVAAGTQRTDAANWGQVQDAVNGVQDWANQKFSQQDTRINRIGAMGAAYGQMAFSAQGLQTANKVGVGVGTQGGQAALAVGYSRQIKPNLNVSFGGSASGSEVSVGAGMSLGW